MANQYPGPSSHPQGYYPPQHLPQHQQFGAGPSYHYQQHPQAYNNHGPPPRMNGQINGHGHAMNGANGHGHGNGNGNGHAMNGPRGGYAGAARHNGYAQGPPPPMQHHNQQPYHPNQHPPPHAQQQHHIPHHVPPPLPYNQNFQPKYNPGAQSQAHLQGQGALGYQGAGPPSYAHPTQSIQPPPQPPRNAWNVKPLNMPPPGPVHMYQPQGPLSSPASAYLSPHARPYNPELPPQERPLPGSIPVQSLSNLEEALAREPNYPDPNRVPEDYENSFELEEDKAEAIAFQEMMDKSRQEGLASSAPSKVQSHTVEQIEHEAGDVPQDIEEQQEQERVAPTSVSAPEGLGSGSQPESSYDESSVPFIVDTSARAGSPEPSSPNGDGDAETSTDRDETESQTQAQYQDDGGDEEENDDEEKTWAISPRRPENPSLAPGIIFASRSRPPRSVVRKANMVLHWGSVPQEDDETADVAPRSSTVDDTDAPTPAPVEVTAAPAQSVTEAPTPSDPVEPHSIPEVTEPPVSDAPPVQEPPAPVAAPAPPPPKKSWASLLRSTPATGSTAGKKSLVSSSVVGFSIPAGLVVPSSSASGSGSAAATPPVPASPITGPMAANVGPIGIASGLSAAQRGTLVELLLAGGSKEKEISSIRPRGIINTGNMCFANSVLQVLLYVPRFRGFFGDLGKALPISRRGFPALGEEAATTSTKRGEVKDNVKAKAKAKAKAGGFPLVDATIEFLEEFGVQDGFVTPQAAEPVQPPMPVPPPAPSVSAAAVSGLSKKAAKKAKAAAAAAAASAASSSSAVTSTSTAGPSDSTTTDNGKGKAKAQGNAGDDRDDVAFIPTYLYDALKEKKRFDGMRGGQQEDAEEFFGFYLETLEEELITLLGSLQAQAPSSSSSAAKSAHEEESLEVEEPEAVGDGDADGWLEVGKHNRTVVTRTIKSPDSAISQLFGGKFRVTLKVVGKKDSAIVEDWRALRVDIQKDQIHTIHDALLDIAQPQSISGSSTVTEATQQTLIDALPEILVVHLKRFEFAPSADGAIGVVKVLKKIVFGPELEIPGEVLSPGAKALYPKGSHGRKYQLVGVIYHHGLSAEGGHYTLDVLHTPSKTPGSTPEPSQARWIRIDDDVVTPVGADDVFDARAGNAVEDRSAYLLFYRKI